MAIVNVCNDFSWEPKFSDILMENAPILKLQDMSDLQGNAGYLERLVNTLESDESKINCFQVIEAAIHLIKILIQSLPHWKQI